jgi:hypothetical protein
LDPDTQCARAFKLNSACVNASDCAASSANNNNSKLLLSWLALLIDHKAVMASPSYPLRLQRGDPHTKFTDFLQDVVAHRSRSANFIGIISPSPCSDLDTSGVFHFPKSKLSCHSYRSASVGYVIFDVAVVRF